MLPIAEAQRAMSAMLEWAGGTGAEVAMAIVDDGGYLQCAARADSANRISSNIAISKAYTAAILRRPTSELDNGKAEVLNGRRNLGLVPMLAVGGGIPIVRDGVVIGAVGVGGVNNALCIECAEAGIAALA